MPPRSELDKVRLNLDEAIRMLQAVAEDLATLHRRVRHGETPAVDPVEASGEGCTTCGELLDNGEGYDGLCGPCADRKEPREADRHLDAAFEDRVNGDVNTVE